MGGAASSVTSSPLVAQAVNPMLGTAVSGVQAIGGVGVLKNLGDQLSQGFKGGISGITGPEGAPPEMAKIQQGTSIEDVQKAQQGAANSLQSQQALLQALQAQGGLGMQNTAANNLQGTAALYQNIAQGGGPNPAQAMLNQATGQNVANQAALMAGQRGAGANVGLFARQAAQQGANTQQQAAGQGATMQANQQINALAGLTNAQQAYANQANQIAGQQIGGTNALTQANLSNQQQMQNALQGVNNANVAAQGSVNAGNVGLSQTSTQGRGDIFSGILQAGGAGAKMATGKGGARGGLVNMADGGQVPGATSSFGQFLMSKKMANGGLVKAMVSEKEVVVPPEKTKSPEEAAKFVSKELSNGGEIKAKSSDQKAIKKGNSYANDKIPAELPEGAIVIPRSVTQSKDPTAAAAKFVSQVLAKRKVRK